MILSDVLLGSQDILDDSFWGPQKRFFGFSFGGYVEGGDRDLYFFFTSSLYVKIPKEIKCKNMLLFNVN